MISPLIQIDDQMLHTLRTVYITNAEPQTPEGRAAAKRLKTLGFLRIDKHSKNSSYCRLTEAGYKAIDQLIIKKQTAHSIG